MKVAALRVLVQLKSRALVVEAAERVLAEPPGRLSDRGSRLCCAEGIDPTVGDACVELLIEDTALRTVFAEDRARTRDSASSGPATRRPPSPPL